MSRNIWILILFAGFMPSLVSSQTLQNQPVLKYMLLDGSELIVECPICALAPITLPLRGTAGLQAVEFTPAYALYAVTNVDFTAGTVSGQQYDLTGSGTYRAPGLPSFGQAMSLNLHVSSNAKESDCGFTNASATVTAKMPVIQINLDQSNGTVSTTYHLKLLAAPVLQLLSVTAAPGGKDVRLQWVSDGLPVQVERAFSLNAAFVPVGEQTTDETFVDTGALTNHSPIFYRLRWNGP